MRIPTVSVGLLAAALIAGCGRVEEEELPPPSPSAAPLWKQLPDKPPGPTPALPSGKRRSFGVEQVAKGFTTPVQAVPRPGRPGTLYVVEQPGTLRAVDVRTGEVARRPLLDVRDEVLAGGERGLLSALFHDGDLYVLLTRKPDGDSRVVRFAGADPDRRETLLEVDQPYENHKGGTLLADARGRVLVGLGDGGSAFDPEQRGQDRRSRLGKLLRYDPARPERGWETVAIGLRNPWRMSFDDATGKLWIGDVGQDRVEEVNALALPEDVEDEVPNLGWAAFEGHLPLGRKRLEPGPAPVWPVAAYLHRDDRCSVTGGPVYRGAALPRLRDRYLFADFCTGELFTMNVEGRPRVRLERAVVPGPAAFAVLGEQVFLVSIAGSLHRLTPAARR